MAPYSLSFFWSGLDTIADFEQNITPFDQCTSGGSQRDFPSFQMGGYWTYTGSPPVLNAVSFTPQFSSDTVTYADTNSSNCVPV